MADGPTNTERGPGRQIGDGAPRERNQWTLHAPGARGIGVGNERGVALVLAVMATMLLTALGTALVMVTRTETMIASNHRHAAEALYAADAGVERVVQDLSALPEWNRILDDSTKSAFVDGRCAVAVTLPAGGSLDLANATARLQARTQAVNLWSTNNPTWRAYACGRVSDLLPTGTIESQMYVMVWVGDDPTETDGEPTLDTNGVLTLHAVAYGPGGTVKAVEATVARAASGAVRILSWREIR
jgi:Tfp pilus assembly protein PilX